MAVVLWNAVPWFLREKAGKRIRAASSEDLDVGLGYLHRLLAELPWLAEALVLGGAAQRVEAAGVSLP